MAPLCVLALDELLPRIAGLAAWCSFLNTVRVSPEKRKDISALNLVYNFASSESIEQNKEKGIKLFADRQCWTDGCAKGQHK